MKGRRFAALEIMRNCHARMFRAVKGGQPMEREYIGIDVHNTLLQVCAVIVGSAPVAT